MHTHSLEEVIIHNKNIIVKTACFNSNLTDLVYPVPV